MRRSSCTRRSSSARSPPARTGLLPERYRQRIFNTRAPHSFPTFLVDGRVTGTWRHEDGRIRLEPFEPLPRGVRRELDDEAERLAVFHGE